MFAKQLYRIVLGAFFLFVMTGLVVNYHTTYGQSTPTPTLKPLPTGLPTLQPLPSGLPTLQPKPTGVPTLVLPPTQPPVSGGGVVFGFVNDVNDDSLKGVTVSITGTADYSNSTETDDNGYYEFRDLAAGDYTVTYEKDGYQTQSQDISLVENEVKDLDTITMEVVVKAKISGDVVDVKGEPIENVKLRLKGITTGYNSTVSSDADGLFEFNDLEADTYVLIAKKKGYKNAKKTIKLVEGDEQEIEVEMKKSSKRIIKAHVH